MSSYAFKVGKPNVNVETAANKDLIFSSDFNTFKIYKILRFTSAGSQAHGLTYPPAFIALEKDGTVWRKAGVGYMGGGLTSVYVDATNVYSNSANEIYVTLFIDPLNE